MGIISERRRQQRAQRMRRRLMIAACVLMLCALAMTPQLRQKIAQFGAVALPVFDQSTEAEMTLPKREIYALQLGVFDSGERAAAEVQRLQQTGVRCIIWQREKMRIISSVALKREGLSTARAGGNEAYVIKDVLERITLRIRASAGDLAQVQQLLQTPDEVLMHLLTGEMDLVALVKETRARAQEALHAHPENPLYTQLAQSLVNWCALMETDTSSDDEQAARDYAAVTMCTLCRELRLALKNQASAASTASAQRTPSTAADVMPPA